MKTINKMLIRLEGYRQHPYKCTEGKLTCGIGRNLDDKGLSFEESCYLADNDLKECLEEASKFDWFQRLDQYREDAVLLMIFQLGVGGFKKFKKMIAAIEDKNWPLAAAEMLDSLWAKQTPQRAQDMAFMMEFGAYPEWVKSLS